MKVLVLIMGVSGSGKTTFALNLEKYFQSSKCKYVEADDYHSKNNHEKISRGQGLTDADRAPWLEKLVQVIETYFAEFDVLLVACSALKKKYRDKLLNNYSYKIKTIIVYLNSEGATEQLKERLRTRKNHFAKESILKSQLETLEPPKETECSTLINISVANIQEASILKSMEEIKRETTA